MNEIDNGKMASYRIVVKASDTRDQMLSTTFSH